MTPIRDVMRKREQEQIFAEQSFPSPLRSLLTQIRQNKASAQLSENQSEEANI